jgi:polar amino acid transport system substrate-binding protein
MANSFRSDGSRWGSVIPDPRVEDLARAGRVRFGFFPSFMYTKDPATHALRGVGIEIARALAARLGVELLPIEYAAPPKVMEALNAGACDVGFLGIDSSRIAEVDFSPPLMEVDWTYLVPAGSSIHSVADADRSEVRIAVVRHHAMDLALGRILNHAKPLRAETPDGTFDMLRAGQADVQAGVRSALLEYSTELPGSRVLEDRYGSNSVAMAVPKGQAKRLAYISEFVEEAKASGLVQRAIERAGLRGIAVAPLEALDTRK